MTCGLGETTIEPRRSPRARHLHIGAVKGEPPALVDIESVMHHPTNDASGLADAKDQDLAWSGGAFKRVIAEISEQIANTGKARAADLGILGGVNQFV